MPSYIYDRHHDIYSNIRYHSLSDHVHTFYGPPNVSPDTTYDDLIASTQNSGNVEENKSLYWHPSVYNYNHDTDTFELDDIWFASAYYIWTTGEATAFPDGFKMVAGLYEEDLDLVRADAECVDPSPCEKSNCETTNDFFPETACSELEVSMAFPSCWDGVNIDSENHRDHVSRNERMNGVYCLILFFPSFFLDSPLELF